MPLCSNQKSGEATSQTQHMNKWLKIILGILLFLGIVAAVLHNTFLKDSYISPPSLSGNISEETIISSNQERTFLWYAPKNVTSSALVFVLHGSTGTGEGVRQQTAYEFDQLSDQEGFVVVYPTGYFNHWNDCRGSADYKANIDNIDDITFLKAIESTLSKKLNHTFTHRFATGHSNGGHFCFKLALEAPDWIDGIAAISANLPVEANLDCNKSQKFVPLLLINGTEDKVNPYNGGLVSILGNDSRGTVLSSNETMNYWLQLGACSTTATQQKVDNLNKDDQSSVEISTWKCNGQEAAMLYKIIGGGHTIPHTQSGMPKILGNTNQDINAGAEIWRFFKTQIK